MPRLLVLPGILSALLILQGCDVALITFLALDKKSASKNSTSGPSGPASGTQNWKFQYTVGGVQHAGGAALSPSGVIYVAFVDVGGSSNNIDVLQVSGTGVPTIPATTIQGSVTSAGGLPAIAIDPSGFVYTVFPYLSTDLLVKKFDATFSSTPWNYHITSPSSVVSRIGAHGIALDATATNAIVVAGVDFGVALGGLNRYMQRFATADGSQWIAPPAPTNDPNGNYYHGVAIVGADDIYPTGSMTTNASPVQVSMYLEKAHISTQGVSVWSATGPAPNNGSALGYAAGVDASGNIYVVGSGTTASTGKDSMIWKFSSSGAPVGGAWPLQFDGATHGDDEFLDVSVQADGTLYATGYETGTGMVLYKISPGAAVEWKQIFDNGTGTDRGVSLVTTSNSIIVIGETTVAPSNTNIFGISYTQ